MANYRKNVKRKQVGIRQRAFTLEELGCRCHLCGRKVNMGLSGMAKWGPTVDHLIPVSAGGADVIENVALAHRECNIKRNAYGDAQLKLIA